VPRGMIDPSTGAVSGSPGGSTPGASLVRVLVVEDDPSIAEPLVEGLEYAGFDVNLSGTARGALAALEQNSRSVDLILLDLGLPDLDGAEVCRRLRALTAVPIIVVSARGDELDRVLLLEMGADDYVVKPFGLRELIARVRAVLRRVPAADPAGPSTWGVAPPRHPAGVASPVPGLTIDRARRTVTVHGRPVDLTAKEFDLLAYLAADPGVVCRREDILAAVWDENWWGSTKTLDVHVATLRRKLGDVGWISTVRGVGYRLSSPT